MSKETFGRRLKELREAASLTQQQLAEKAGLNQFGVAKLEQGVRSPAWETVQALARALGVSCQAFEEDAGQAEPPPAKKTRKRK